MSETTVNDAINDMRELSKKRKSFRFTSKSWSETKQTCDGIKEVRRTKQENRTKVADYLDAEMVNTSIQTGWVIAELLS